MHSEHKPTCVVADGTFIRHLDIDRLDGRVGIEGGTGAQHQVGVLAHLNGAHPVFDARVPGRVDGNGLEGGEGFHAVLDGKARAQGQVFLGDHRRVGDDGHRNARFAQDAGGGEGFVPQFKFAGVGEGGAHGAGHVFLGQLVGDQVAFGHVL